jgi:hypothetical protein
MLAPHQPDGDWVAKIVQHGLSVPRVCAVVVPFGRLVLHVYGLDSDFSQV